MEQNTTQLLSGVVQGNRQDAEALMPLVYDELRVLAAKRLQAERAGHTLQPTALVNEVYLRMIDQTRVDWRDRSHFFAVAASVMRRILIDHARKRAAEKRGGGARRLMIEPDFELTEDTNPADLVALDDLLNELCRLNERHARIVELRFFTGLNISETAEALGVSTATVKNDWRVARAWLMSQLGPENE